MLYSISLGNLMVMSEIKKYFHEYKIWLNFNIMSDKLHLQSGFFYLFILSRDFCAKCEIFALEEDKKPHVVRHEYKLASRDTVNRVLRVLYWTIFGEESWTLEWIPIPVCVDGALVRLFANQKQHLLVAEIFVEVFSGKLLITHLLWHHMDIK